MEQIPHVFPSMHPATLALRKGKWYVAVTVPKSLEHLFPTKQIRRSTGTSDKSLAKLKQHAIAQSIYEDIKAGWLTAKSKQPTGLEMWNEAADALAKSLGLPFEKFQPIRYRKYLDQAAQDILNDWATGEERSDEELSAALDYVHWETIDEAEWASLNDQQESTVDKIVLRDTALSASTRTVLGVLPQYLEGTRWTRLATKKGAERHIRAFASKIGNLPIENIEKTHAYAFAKTLDSEGKANKTIKSAVSSVSAFLRWCEQEALIKASQFSNLDLSRYGTPPEKYIPLSKDELTALFSLNMPDQDRLLLSILITTGMRLDEAALMTWQRVKEEDGLRCFDLTDYHEAITIKNKQSLRLVPIPACLKLPMLKTEGDIFTYARDEDGKAEGAASKQLMKHIRKVTRDRRKAVHSLRGNFKDLMRNSGASKELNDFITGHGSNDEGGKYGNGFWLAQKAEALNKIEHPWLLQ